MLARAKALFKHHGYDASALTTNLNSGRVEDEPPGVDVVADSLARSHPEHFQGYEDLPARLLDLFREGKGQALGDDEAYEQALDHLRNQGPAEPAGGVGPEPWDADGDPFADDDDPFRARESLLEAAPAVAAPKRYASPVEAMLSASMGQGSALLVKLARAAIGRLVASGGARTSRALFSPEERLALANELGAARASGDLLARALVRDHGERARRKGRTREHLEAPVQAPALEVPAVLQSTDYTCGAACLKACLDYHGLHLGEGRAARLLGTTPAGGTSPEALASLAGELGLRTQEREGASIEDLAHALGLGAPCICAVRREGGGHYVVVAAIGEGTVTVMDPMDGPRTVSRDTWLRDWWDHAEGRRYERWALAVGAPVEESERPSPLHRLLEGAPLPALQPEAALDFFRHLVPSLHGDPLRLEDGRRTAFTLAVATEEELLQAVQGAITAWLGQDGAAPLDTPKAIAFLLDEAGVSPANPQYAEQVFRTNAMDAYNTGAQEEIAREQETFPVWRYSNPCDSRSRPSHAARNGNYYPSSRPFNLVRGTGKEDVINDRCTPIPIDRWEWAELQAEGVTLAGD